MPSNRAIVSAASELLGMRFNRFDCQVMKLQWLLSSNKKTNYPPSLPPSFKLPKDASVYTKSFKLLASFLYFKVILLFLILDIILYKV